MSLKSFNVDTSVKFRHSIALGALLGVVIDLVGLPAAWRWIAQWVGHVIGAVGDLGFVGLFIRDDYPKLSLDNPAEALPDILASYDDTFLIVCAFTFALCLGASVCFYLTWALWLYDGSWIGGRRAKGAPIHGDARLISKPSELERLSETWRIGKRPTGGTLAVGSISGSIKLIDSVHGCVLAESGEGKSRRIAIPTALANFLQGRSLVINDIKGELRAFLEPYFREVGTHRIVDVMFDAPASSARFDPLARAKAAYREEGPGGAVRELRELARCIVPNTDKGQPFFSDGARNLFIGLSLHVIAAPGIPDEQRTVMSVATAMSPLYGESSLDRIGNLAATLPSGDPALPFLSGLNGESSGAPGIISTLSTYLSEYVDDNVARMLHDDECALDRIGEEPTVVFISSSSATGNYRRLVQTYIAQALSALRVTASRHAGRCPVETVMVLDEAASLGRNERMLQDLGETRSEGIHVMWFCQSLVQLQSVSGYSREEAETILDLLKDKVILSCPSVETARKLSESMGSYTAIAESHGRTKAPHTGSSSRSKAIVRRPLISTDELQRWTGRTTGALVIHDGKPMAFPSLDVTETFVGPMLGMTSQEAERKLMEDALAKRETRNLEVPPTWAGPRLKSGTAAKKTPGVKTVPGYAPEGF